MTYDYCKVCNVTCCSEYNYKEHINGRKHAENLKRKPLGNATNRYNTTSARSHGVPSTQATKRVSNKREAPKNTLRVDFKLVKGVCEKEDEAPKEEVPDKKQVFSIFDTPTPPKKKEETKSQFPTVYKDLFKRKKNVNLYVRDNKVFWQFSYNAQVIAGIKAHVPGRQWNPALKEWSCPLESLPIALALYKHMGRTPDAELARRAEEMSKTCPDPSGVVTLSVAVGGAVVGSVGTVDVKFIYNAEIVSAIKCLPPTQRSYDPTTKIWPVDLLALPELLDHLKSIGFHQAMEDNVLSQLCTCCEKIATIMYDEEEEPEGDTTNERGAQSKAKEWKDELQTIIKLLKEHSKTQAVHNSSDCGERKTRKLTTAQKVWSMKKQGLLDEDDCSYYGITYFGGDHEDDDHDYDNDCVDDEYYGFSFDDMYNDFVRPVTTTTNRPTDCDCGHPEKLSRGRHQCRYYGTFHCGCCGNTWTSAYTWKGEKQACKGCNQESYPAKKEPLQSGLGRPGGGGHHDTERCSRCRRLGYNCSMY